MARANLDELLLDYEDVLRQRGLRAWTKDDNEASEVRAVAKTLRDRTDRTDRSDLVEAEDGDAHGRWISHPDPALVANAIICLIHPANYLLDQQISSVERAFVEGGGYTEQLAKARVKYRQARCDESVPACPACGGMIVVRMVRAGSSSCQASWCCSAFPKCKGTRQLG